MNYFATPESFLSDTSHSCSNASLTFSRMMLMLGFFGCAYFCSNFLWYRRPLLSLSWLTSVVMSGVLASGHQLKILGSIIQTVLVLVMYHLVWLQRATQYLLHYVAMLKHLFPVDGNPANSLMYPAIRRNVEGSTISASRSDAKVFQVVFNGCRSKNIFHLVYCHLFHHSKCVKKIIDRALLLGSGECEFHAATIPFVGAWLTTMRTWPDWFSAFNTRFRSFLCCHSISPFEWDYTTGLTKMQPKIMEEI